jgi:hypothetical protein
MTSQSSEFLPPEFLLRVLRIFQQQQDETQRKISTITKMARRRRVKL